MISALLDRPAAPVDDATRRQFLIGGAGLAALIAGCSSQPDGTSDPSGSGDGRFPVTIEHKYGSTVIPAEPVRVVTAGITEQDPVLALGVRPVGVTEFFGEQPFGTWPWARHLLGGTEPEVLPDGFTSEFDLEAIAALRPDLIIGTHSAMDSAAYGKLAAIAPTVAQSGEHADYETPWQEETRTIARALGRTRRAEELIAEVEAQFRKVRAQHPEFGQATAVLVETPSEGQVRVWTPSSVPGQFLISLGFDVPAELLDFVRSGDLVDVSLERLDIIDRDVVLWDAAFGGRADIEAIEAIPLHGQLDAAAEGREVFVQDLVLYAAIPFGTVLSLPFALDRIVPMLAAAVDGDPTTEVPQ